MLLKVFCSYLHWATETSWIQPCSIYLCINEESTKRISGWTYPVVCRRTFEWRGREFKDTTTMLIQVLPELSKSHDRYVNFYRQTKFFDGFSKSWGGGGTSTPYFGTPLNVPFWLQMSFYILPLEFIHNWVLCLAKIPYILWSFNLLLFQRNHVLD